MVDHSIDGKRVSAKVLIDAPGGAPPSEAQLEGIWQALNGKTDKEVALTFYLVDMPFDRAAWAVAMPSGKQEVAICTFDHRLPEQYRQAP